ncbi:MAG: hypothetical protein ACRYHA_17335 [Janthinobacterium lividum]
MKKRNILALLLFSACGVRAQTTIDSEKNAYCRYVETAADAEKTLDTGLQAVGGVGQSDNESNATQAEVGIRKSLSKHLQGNAAVRLAALECELYDKRLDVERIVKYKMSFIDSRVALQHVSDLIAVLGIVDEELAAAQKREHAQDATLADVMTLKQRRAEIFEQYLSARASVAGIDFPPLSDGNLEQSLIEANELALQVQKERHRRDALQSWDVSVGAGLRRTLAGDAGGSANGLRPFVTLNFTYNFNARAYRQKLDDSAAAFMTLSHEKDDALTHQVAVLQERIAASLAEQEALLLMRHEMTNYWNAQFRRIATLTSPDALRLRAQIRINLAMAAMNEHLSRYKIAFLKGDHAQS